MKKLFSAIALAAAVLMTFAACTKQEMLDTNQYPQYVSLASFGPNPVLRGGTLSFFGSKLEEIVKVQIPGVGDITEITVVKEGVPSEISVSVPVEGPQIGKVILTDKSGKTYTTKSDLTYTEPIVFDSFEANAKVFPGDVIKIKGDYMNLIRSVIFEGGTAVSVNEGGDRHNTSVTVPADALSGKIVLSDGLEIPNLIYSKNEITMGEPAVTALSVATAKPGMDAVISGTHLEMIDKLTFEGTGDVEEFTIAADGKSITVKIPATAKDGAVNAVSYAGKSYTAGDLATVKPTELAAAPSPVKAGQDLTISGKDLDIITTVDFDGAAGQTFAYDAEAKTIKVNVPATAKEGDITLSAANGDAVTVAFTLVHPVITAVAPTALKAGEDITVTGTDLDLVTKASLGGKEVSIKSVSDDGTTLVLATANTSVPGTITLELANGEKIADATDISLSYDSLIIVNEMPASVHIGELATFKGENFMLIENLYIGDAKVTRWVSRSDTSMSFIMPYNSAPATYSVKFQLYNGDVETCPTQIEVGLEINHIIAWEGSTQITWNDGGRVYIPASKFDGVTPGTKMMISFTQVDQQWDQAQINYGDWSGLVFPEIGSNTLVPTDIYGWFPDGILDRVLEVTLTKEILSDIQAKKGDSEGNTNVGIIIQGTGLTFTKFEILQEISQEVTIFEGPVAMTWGDDGRFGLAMTYFEAAHAGSKLIFYIEQTDAWGQIQLNDGYWANGDMNFPEIGGAYINTDNAGGKDVTRIELTLTEDVLNHILATAGDYFGVNTQFQGDGRVAMVVQGSDMIVTKVCIL